jgi:hypothetical protein
MRLLNLINRFFFTSYAAESGDFIFDQAAFFSEIYKIIFRPSLVLKKLVRLRKDAVICV